MSEKDDAHALDLFPSTIDEAASALRDGSLTCVELAQAHLDCIERLEPKLNAFIQVTAQQTLTTAAELDSELEAGKDRGLLHGIPVVYKDIFDVAGLRTTVGSKLFENSEPKRQDATVVRLLKAAGTVSLGKNNLTEFSTDGTGRNVFYGNTHNPWDLGRSPGGSSGGTAAAVAAGMCLGGVGGDTGGSVRFPASLCGIVGVRPTKGLVSVTGAFPRAHSLDVPGPLARTVADATMLLGAMVEDYDPSRGKPIKSDYTADLDRGVCGMRLGIIADFTFRNIDAEVATAVHAAVEKLSSLGAEIITVDIPLLGDALDHSKLLDVLLYEFHQILGDWYRAAEGKSVFGPIVQNNLERGIKISRERYEEALAQRPEQAAEVRKVFERVDALLTPTQPMVTPTLEADFGVFERMRQFLLPASFVGLPSVSVPCGFNADGLPLGLQIIGDHLEEAIILRVASAFEAATGFHKMRPPIHIENRR